MEKSLKHSSGRMAPFPEETTMDLLLWRHAEAEEGPIDLQRRLTKRGEKQAKAMAQWLKEHKPKDLRILVSPAVRCQQTAQALDLPFETHRRLGPEACVSDLVAISGWPGAGGSVMVVGHQPTLGRMASLLLSGQEADWTIKKGAVWWFTNRVRQEETQTVLRAVIFQSN
jgi:phosphohistidine phosphatase